MAFEGDLKTYAPAEVDEVGAIILKARELLSDPAKWFKGNYECADTGAKCILGALGENQFPLSPAVEEACRRVEGALPPGMYFTHVFNDALSTTHADVLALLDRAAAQSGDA